MSEVAPPLRLVWICDTCQDGGCRDLKKKKMAAMTHMALSGECGSRRLDRVPGGPYCACPLGRRRPLTGLVEEIAR